jgi:hypothetical protein
MFGGIAIFLCPPVLAVAPTGSPPLIAAEAGTSNDSLGAAVAFAFMGLCSLVFAVTRATAARRTFVTSRRKVTADLELLHLVARTQRVRALAFAAACALVALVIANLPIAVETRIALSVTPGLMLMVGLVSAWQLHRLIGVRADRDVRVSSHGEILYAARDDKLIGWVSAPPRLVAHATALPVAQLRVH